MPTQNLNTSPAKPDRKRRLIKIASGLVLTGALLLAGGLFWMSHHARSMAFLGPMPTCKASVAHLGGLWGTTAISVELAETAEQRERGLMFREELAAGTGMLFVYPEPRTVAFWMKNTPIPLDLLFFDEVGNLRHIHFNAQPFDETAIPGGTDIQYVLELYAGETTRLGIGPQTALRHPALNKDVVRWGC